MKRLFYNCSTLLMMAILGLSVSYAQPGCPPDGTVPSIPASVCIDAIPGTFDLTTLGTGAAAGVHGWTVYSAVDQNGAPLNPVTTTQVLPNTFYLQYTTPLGLPCTPTAVATFEVLSKDPAPFTTQTVCADNTPPGPIAALAGGVYDLTTIPGIDKWYLDPSFLNLVTNATAVPPGTYFGTVDGSNTSNGCESAPAVVTVNAAPYVPVLTAPVGTICANPVTGTFNLDDVFLASNPADPNYPPIPFIPRTRYVFTSDAGLTSQVVPGPVPAGTYYVYHTLFQCASMALEFTVEPREVAPVLDATEACVDNASGLYNLCDVGSDNPLNADLTWYASLTDVENGGPDLGTCPADGPINVAPGTYYATYQGIDCESAPTAFVVNETPAQLTAYNCGGTAGNNAGGPGNCVEAGLPHIRLFSCTDAVFTTANVENEIKTNDQYGLGINGGVVANAVLTYYDNLADVGNTPVALATILTRFDNDALNNDPRTENVFVTQTDPNTGCESAPSALRLRMRARPDVVVTTPAAICIGQTVDLFTLVADDRNVAESWNIYDTDPSLGPAVLLSTSTADAGGEPDGSVVFEPSFTTDGTFTFWYEAINEGNTYNSGCNEIAPVTITVLPKPVITGAALPNPVCSGEAFIMTFLDANGDPIPSGTVNDVDVTAIVDGGLTVVSGPTQGNGLTIGAISTDVFENFTNGPLDVTYTITPNGPLPQNCPGDPIIVTVTINPEPIMAAGLTDTACSYTAANLALSSTNGLTGVTYQWVDDPGSFPFFAPTPNPTLSGPQSFRLPFIGTVIPGLHDKYPAPFANYGRPVASADPITDIYSNVTTGNATATYTIIPVSAAGCEGNPETAEVVTRPAPIINIVPGLGDTICSGGTTNIALSAQWPLSINVAEYKWDVPAYPAGVTGPANGSGGTNPGSYVAVPQGPQGQIFITESFTNTTGAPVVVTLTLVAKGEAVFGSCESLPYDVDILVNPEPVLQSNWPALLCSNNPTVDLNVVAPTETSGTGCATGVWERNMGSNWVVVSGVQTVSNGDEFRYTCTTVDGCTSSLTETVNLEDAPVVTPVPNPPLCADNVNLNATIVDLDGNYTPTVTNSVGGAYVHTAEWQDIFGNVVNPANAVTVRNGDTYNYVVTGANGCTETVSYTFIVNPLPNVVLTGGGTICPPATSTNDVVASFTTTGPWTFTYTIDGVAQPVVNTGLATYTFTGSGSVPGSYQITSITDGNGCTTMAGYGSNSVTVAAPNTIAAICRNITEQIDGNGFAAITGGDIDENSGFGCNSNVTLTRLAYPAIFTCADLGPNNVTLKVFDPATPAPHDTATCVSIVTVEDNINPSIVCANNAAKDTDLDQCYWTVPDGQLDPLFTDDNCTVVSVTHNYTGGGTYTASSLQGAEFPKGQTLVTWTVTDQSGNQDACVMSVDVTDNQAPVITNCPPSRQIFTSTDGGYDCESDIPDMLPELTWTDNCPTCVTVSQAPVGGANVAGAHLDVTTVTFTVGDDNQAVTCTAVLTLIDDQDPMITCPDDTTINCDVTDRTALALGEATATDNCSNNITITYSDLVDLTLCNNTTGTIIRTFTADDNNVDPLLGTSNTASCTQVITVQDTTPPVIAGFVDPTEYCDFSDIPRFTFSGFAAASGVTPSDNCSLDTTTFRFVSQNIVGNCGATVTEIYAVSDYCGNESQATVIFTVDDNVIPVWDNAPAIADTTVDCDQNTASANTGVPTWTDNCFSTIAEADGNSTFVNNPADCGYYSYSFDRTFTVTDICGNSISHTQTITVQDTTAPAITCTSNIPGNTVDTDTDKCEATIGSGLLTAAATDNCATSNLTYSYVVVDNNDPLNTWNGLGSDAAGVYPKGSYTITFTSADPCGNASSCSLTLDVEDNQDPFIACVGTLDVYLDDNGNATIVNGDIVSSSSDNCPDAVVVLDKYTFDCSEVTAVTGNTISVTATITDASGNTATCATDVTVIDALPPTPDCEDITVYLDGLGATSITAADVAGNATDNCAIVSTVANKTSFDCSDLTILSGNNPFLPVEVTVTYTDPSGNTSDCIARVTVRDTIPPSITCLDPAPVNNTPGLCEAPVVVPVPSSGDNCFVRTLTNDYTGLPSANATYPVGTTVVTWTVIDRAGNSTDCVVDVVVIDNEDPNAICKDITVQLDATGNASITAADLDDGSNDNCPGFVLSLNDTDFDCSDIQGQFNTNNVVPVTLTITDGAGLTDQATCNVTVRDEVAPDALCMNAVAMLDANGAASITVADVDNGSSDACGIFDIQVNPNQFDCSNVGNNTVTLQVMDNNGNMASCTATVDVQDNIAPTAVCQDTIVQLDMFGNGVLSAAMVDDGSDDNCGVASLAVSPNTFDCSQRNQTVAVTLTVTDVNGNTSDCAANVLVKDEVSPTAKCRDLTIQLDANGDASITVADVDNGTIDNCMLVSVTIDDMDFDCTDVGTNAVTLTAVDADGNDATCIATITVEDNVAPDAQCMNAVVELDANGAGSIAVSDIDNGSSDACGIVTYVLSETNFTCADLGTNTVTLTVTDTNGNTAACTGDVDVQDNINPDVVYAGAVQFCNDAGVCEAAVSIIATATDNCTIITETWSVAGNPGPRYAGATFPTGGTGLDASGTYPVGEYTVTFTVIDQSGNIDQEVVNFEVDDCEAPVITQAGNLCGTTVTLPNVAGDCYQQYAWDTPVATDNCNVASFVRTLSDPSVQPLVIAGTTLGLFPVGTTTVTYTAQDDEVNTTVCAFDVVVEDTEDPVILNCPTATISVNNDPGNCSAQVVLPNNITAIDNCPIVTISDDVPAGSIFPLGTTTVTFTATDNSGRTATCSFDVEVADTEAPVIACPANIAVSNDPGECGATVVYADPSWTDNCTGFVLGSPYAPNTLTATPSLVAAGSTLPAAVQPSIPLSSTTGIGDGSVDLSNAPAFISLTGTNINFDVDGTAVSFTAITTGTFTFDYLYSSDDVGGEYDPFGYTINNGPFVALENDAVFATGSESINLNAGDVFSWVIFGDGFFGTSTAVISVNDGSTSLTQIAGLGSGAQFPIGTTTETWVIRDGSGNTDTCSFDITVTDDQDPTITSSGTSTISSTANGTGGPLADVATTNFFAPVNANVVIEDIDLALDGTHTWVGDLSFTLTSPTGTVVELGRTGGSNTDDFDIIFDDESPSALNNSSFVSPFGQGLRWRSNGSGSMADFEGENAFGPWTLTIEDNVTGDVGTLDAWSLTITSIDPNGVAAPVTVTIPSDAGQCGAQFSYANLVADDNCPGVTLTQTSGLGSGSVFPVGTTTETYVATDASGNTTSYTFDITVEDTEAPTITCPPSATIGNDAGDCDATLAYTIVTNDNCPNPVLTQTSGVGNGGSVAVGSSSTESYTVTDAAGNTAACSFTITVEDQEAPQISGCPANIGPLNNDPGDCGAVATWNTNNLAHSDNCPGETLSSNWQSGDLFPVGTTTVVYTVTDAAGLTADCSFTVEVIDVEDPVITCPANVSVTQDVSLYPNCGSNITGFIASATDNCSATITNDAHPAGGADASGFYPLGTTTVTFTATDPAGNNVSCTADVTVTAIPPVAQVNNANPMNICSTSPSITASGNIPGIGFAGQWTASPSTGVVFGSPNANISTVTFPGAGTYTITWTVTSLCTGATDAASFTVNVFDPPTLDFSCSTDPTIVGGSDGVACVTASGGSGSYSYLWSTGATTSSVAGLPAGTYSVVVTDLVSGCSSNGSVTLVDPPVTRICELEDFDAAGYGVWFRLAGGSIPGNGNYTWVGGNGTYREYASGEVQITGTIMDKVDNTKVWNVDIWLIGKQFWGSWGATNGWAGAPATVGTQYTSWTYYTLNGSKSTLTGAGFFAGASVTLTHRPYAANGGNGGFQVGQAANNNNAQYGMYGEFDYTGTYAGRGAISGRFNNCIGTQRLGPVAVLQGAYDATSGLMRDDLRAASLVPTTEPYTALGYTHVGGGGSETVAQSVLNTTGLDAIVDWVIVELRESANPANVIASRSALMQADGDIVDVDGVSSVEFNAIADGDYYVAILHRNHVGIMTGNALTLIGNAPTATTVDFTTTTLYGGPTAYATVGAGFQAMVAGDASFDGQVQNTDDVNFWAPNTGSSGYQAGDYNLDAQVQNTDKVNFWISNAGLGTAIPQ